MAWLWKDHSSFDESKQITQLAKKISPEYLVKCGGTYSSEWFFSKILHCLNIDQAVFDAAYTWVECSDYIPAVLTWNSNPEKIKINRCAAGHKGMFSNEWGGYPSKDFLIKLHPEMGTLREQLAKITHSVDQIAGYLSEEWATKLGLQTGIPVAMGILDAHAGAIGSGVNKGKMVKIIV